MSLIAAFMWRKHPRCSISTMILDSDNVHLIAKPTIYYFTASYFKFRRDSKKVIKEFFNQVALIQKTYQQPVIIEYKIVFHAHDMPYLVPARESKYIYKVFFNYLKKTKLKCNIKVEPQLRKRLSGIRLKQFKRELRSLYLVSRRKDTNYEYHLWTVALHATPATYKTLLKRIRRNLEAQVWASGE